MSEAKFTKGQWRIDDCGDVRSTESDEVIAVVLSDTDELKTAQLIAAAPELYEALEDVLGLISTEYEESPMVASAKAALTKARGEAV